MSLSDSPPKLPRSGNVVILDYGTGNIGSIYNMLKRLERKVAVSNDPAAIASARAILLPGVGAFDAGMEKLQRSGLIPTLHQAALKDRIPVLGICLGMQFLAGSSEEGKLPGLGWLDATVRRFDLSRMGKDAKVPHMGWNRLRATRPHFLMENFAEPPMFYFVHSYHLECAAMSDVVALCDYHYEFPAIVAKENIFGTQFHPEKSHQFGFRLMENFLKGI